MQYDPNLKWFNPSIPGFCDLTGPYKLALKDDGSAIATLVIDENHVNSGGVCHGGLFMTMADIVMGFTAHLGSDKKPSATIELNSKFLAAGKLGQRLIAEAKLLRHTSGISFVECTIWSEGRKVFVANGIWKVLNYRSHKLSLGEH